MSQNFSTTTVVTALPSTAATKSSQVASSVYIASANTTGTQIKTGAGVLHGLSVNTAGTATTATFYDGTSTSGTNLGTYATTTAGVITIQKYAFTTGLFVVLAGTTAGNVSVFYA